MRRSFAKGLIIGGLVGASVSMMMDSEGMNNKKRRRMYKSGRRMLMRSGDIIGNVIDLIR